MPTPGEHKTVQGVKPKYGGVFRFRTNLADVYNCQNLQLGSSLIVNHRTYIVYF